MTSVFKVSKGGVIAAGLFLTAAFGVFA